MDTSAKRRVGAAQRGTTVAAPQSNAAQASTEEKLYKKLAPFLLTKRQLRENEYPLCCSEQGKARSALNDEERRWRRQQSERIEKYCERCLKRFYVTKDGEHLTTEKCDYHARKAVRSGRGQFTYVCCYGFVGCQVARHHVYKYLASQEWGQYVTTRPAANGTPKYWILAVDCEMPYTKFGLELGRITIVNYKLETVYDAVVKTSSPITDYNTIWSGLTERDYEGVETTLEDVHRWILENISAETVLIGHSLESDLHAMKVKHRTVVDTSVVFQDSRGYKQSLKALAETHLGRTIQTSRAGHDSQEDAQCCMLLMIKRILGKI